MAAGVHQSHTQNKRPKLPLVYIYRTAHHGGNNAGTTTKCHSEPLNNKRHKKKLISITYVTICKPPKAPRYAPTLSCLANCLRYCYSPSSIQGTVWYLVKLCVKVGLLTLYSSSSSTIMGGGGLTPSPLGSYLRSKETWKTGCNPWSFLVSTRHTATGPTKATTGNGPTNHERNLFVPARGKFLLESRT